MASFGALFEPRSIAVIGASNRAGTVGKAVMDNLLGGQYSGAIFPINTKSVSFHGLKSYPSVSAVPDRIDLGMIMIPAPAVPNVVEELGRRGTRACIIISAGFKETGEEGARLEQEVARICHHYGIVLLGPNCIGLANPSAHLNATFAATPATAGHVALVSQSGALGTAFLDLAQGRSLGFSKFITIGNKAGLDELELIQYLASDRDTTVIALYLESFTAHPAWVPSLRRITMGHNAKPVVLLKAGVSVHGAQAATSHTGAVAGDTAVYQAFVKQAGVTGVQTIDELVTTCVTLQRNTPPQRSGTAIVTNAGGLGIVATDAAARHSLLLAAISEHVAGRLRGVLPSQASVHNPIDVLGDATAERYAKSLELLANAERVGSIVCIVTPQSMTDASAIAQIFIRFKSTHPGTPIIVSMTGGAAFEKSRQLLDQAGVAQTVFPEDAVKMMSYLDLVAANQRVKHFTYPSVQANLAQADTGIVSGLHRGASVLLPEEAELVLRAYGIPFARSRIAKSAVEAAGYAHASKGAVVLKVISPDVVHKSDVGGVRLSVNASEAGKAFSEIISSVKKHIPHARIEGVLVQPMVEHGLEVLVGAKRDPVFGPAIVVGLGGIYVEVLHDVAMRIAPVSTEEATAMLGELHSVPLLRGVRGQSGMNEEALVDCIIRVSELMLKHPEIQELDLNPVVTNAKDGVEVLDARIVV